MSTDYVQQHSPRGSESRDSGYLAGRRLSATLDLVNPEDYTNQRARLFEELTTQVDLEYQQKVLEELEEMPFPLARYGETDTVHWKKIRRRIKNKISAQESRRRKKEYIETLEQRIKNCSKEKATLELKCERQETEIMRLERELSSLKLTSKPCSCKSGQDSERSSPAGKKGTVSRGTQTGTCLLCYRQSSKTPSPGRCSTSISNERNIVYNCNEQLCVENQEFPGQVKSKNQLIHQMMPVSEAPTAVASTMTKFSDFDCAPVLSDDDIHDVKPPRKKDLPETESKKETVALSASMNAVASQRGCGFSGEVDGAAVSADDKTEPHRRSSADENPDSRTKPAVQPCNNSPPQRPVRSQILLKLLESPSTNGYQNNAESAEEKIDVYANEAVKKEVPSVASKIEIQSAEYGATGERKLARFKMADVLYDCGDADSRESTSPATANQILRRSGPATLSTFKERLLDVSVDDLQSHALKEGLYSSAEKTQPVRITESKDGRSFPIEVENFNLPPVKRLFSGALEFASMTRNDAKVDGDLEARVYKRKPSTLEIEQAVSIPKKALKSRYLVDACDEEVGRIGRKTPITNHPLEEALTAITKQGLVSADLIHSLTRGKPSSSTIEPNGEGFGKVKEELIKVLNEGFSKAAEHVAQEKRSSARSLKGKSGDYPQDSVSNHTECQEKPAATPYSG